MDILEKGKQFLSPVLGHYTELEVVSASGVWVKTAEGRSYLDFTSGVAVTNTGHNHPSIVAAIKAQADQLIHISSGIAYCKPNVDLAEKLVKKTGFQINILGENKDISKRQYQGLPLESLAVEAIK